VLRQFGEVPRYQTFPDPVPTEDELLVQVIATPLANVDRAQAAGTHYSSRATYPTLPAVIGGDGVGLIDGTLRAFGACVPPFGAMAERTIVPKAYASYFLDVPSGVDLALAAAMPASMLASLLPLTFGATLHPGETVLVQGATGFAGRLAVQVAKKLGAGRVIGSGRDRASLAALPALGADAVIDLGQSDAQVAAAFRHAAGEAGYDVILDFLWGRSTEVLLSTFIPEELALAAKRVRLVQIGAAAGHAVSLEAEALRTSGLEILGASAGIIPTEVPALAARAYAWIASGDVTADVEQVALKDIEQAWGREVHGRRLVVMPDISR
jgi:NADPH2:quinone reductase